MSFEVAAVHATLGFRVEGAQEAARFTQQVTAAQEAMERAVGNSSAKVQALSNELQGAVDRLTELENSSTALNQALGAVGSSLNTMESDIQGVNTQMEEQARRIEEARAAYERANEAVKAQRDAVGEVAKEHGLLSEEYNKARDLENQLIQIRGQARDALKAEGDALSELANKQQVLNQVRATQQQLPGVTTDQAAKVETLTGRLNGLTSATQKSADGLKLNQTTMTGLVSAMRSGNVGSAVLAQGIQFLSSGFGVLAIAIGAAAIALFQMGQKLFSMADSLNSVNPAALELAENLQHLEGVDLAGLAGQLGTIQNRLESFGLANTAPVLAEITEIGSTLALLDSQVGNAPDIINKVSRALETFNLEPLRDSGVPVDEFKRQLEALGDVSDEVKREFTGGFLQAFATMPEVLAQAADQAERDSRTFAGLKEELALLWQEAGNSEAVRESIALLVDSFRPLIPVIQDALAAFGVLAAFVVNVVAAALKTISLQIGLVTKGVAALLSLAGRIPGIGKPFQDAAREVGAYSDNILDALFGTEEFENGLSRASSEIFRFGDAASDAISPLKELRDTLSGGFSTIGDLKNIGQAFANIQDGLDPGEATTYFEAISRGIDNIAERGTAQVLRSFEVMRAEAQRLFESGIINEAAFDRAIHEIEATERATAPLIAQVEELEREFGNTQSQADNAAGTLQGTLTPSVANSGNAASVAGDQFRNLASDIATAQAVASQGIHVQITSSSSSIGSSGVGGKAIGGKSSSAVSASAASADRKFFSGSTGGVGGTGSTTSSTSAELGDKTAQQAVQDAAKGITSDFEDALKDFNTAHGVGSTGGGGGGGGGSSAREDRLASIEEIKEFFNQVNAAVLSGIRGGRVFSTAGNAIPLGGPGQFVSSQGGTLIEQVNLRGVWDFADPAAKREIVRQLREALDEFGSEVA